MPTNRINSDCPKLHSEAALDSRLRAAVGNEEKTMSQILRADISDAAEILELQKLAYQIEAIL